jgi:AraC-like DNA-binding protein
MAKKTAAALSVFDGMEGLKGVREVRYPIDATHPLRVRYRHILPDGGSLPGPSLPFPERHPYCEINFGFEGRGEQYIGVEKIMRRPGDVMLIGPGIPHYGTIFVYPVRVVIVHFLPVLLLEMSAVDGARILSRFTARNSISRQIVLPPPALRKQFAGQFQSMMDEADHPRLGSDLALRARLMDILIALLRWEESTGNSVPESPAFSNWSQVEKTLRLIYERYAEPLYTEQIAREAGLSADGLHQLFHDAFGMSCIQYLNAYRISQAAALLCIPGSRVTEVAPAVGFETLSHFKRRFAASRACRPPNISAARKRRTSSAVPRVKVP